jgi:hypothetical protein
MVIASLYKGGLMSETVFTDEQVTRACNLHIDNLRRLITWGGAKPVQAGGGRGRVRLWSFAQAMRVAATAEFFEAGFSLQMAHTLTYCLPLDYLLQPYDPEFIKKHVNLKDPKEAHIKRLLSRRGENYWMPDDTIGNIIIIDRQLVYGDILVSENILYGIISKTGNRYYPFWSPSHLYHAEDLAPPSAKPAIIEINQRSLLIDQHFFEDEKEALRKFRQKFVEDIETQIDDPIELICRNYLKISLNVGLVIAFRKLLGLPVAYDATYERLNG